MVCSFTLTNKKKKRNKIFLEIFILSPSHNFIYNNMPIFKNKFNIFIVILSSKQYFKSKLQYKNNSILTFVMFQFIIIIFETLFI